MDFIQFKWIPIVLLHMVVPIPTFKMELRKISVRGCGTARWLSPELILKVVSKHCIATEQHKIRQWTTCSRPPFSKSQKHTTNLASWVSSHRQATDWCFDISHCREIKFCPCQCWLCQAALHDNAKLATGREGSISVSRDLQTSNSSCWLGPYSLPVPTMQDLQFSATVAV